MNNGVLPKATIKTLVNQGTRDVVPMSHTARGGESIINEGKVKKKKVRGSAARSEREALGNRGQTRNREGEGREIRS